MLDLVTVFASRFDQRSGNTPNVSVRLLSANSSRSEAKCTNSRAAERPIARSNSNLLPRPSERRAYDVLSRVIGGSQSNELALHDRLLLLFKEIQSITGHPE